MMPARVLRRHLSLVVGGLAVPARLTEVFCASFIYGLPSDTWQTKHTSNMEQMLAEKISNLLALSIMSRRLPTCVTVPDCCGLSEMDIKNKYSKVNVLPGCRPGEEIIEARMPGRTISFRMHLGVCLAGYVFEDREDIWREGLVAWRGNQSVKTEVSSHFKRLFKVRQRPIQPQKQVKSDGVAVGRLKGRKRNTSVLLLAFDNDFLGAATTRKGEERTDTHQELPFFYDTIL